MKHNKQPVRRIFVIGCPRSGTTIVQAQLASLPGVFSLAETHFFVRLLGHFDRWLYRHPRLQRTWKRRAWLVSGRTHRRLRRTLDEALGPDAAKLRLPRRWTARAYVRRLVKRLDAMARESGQVAWVEKTPDHLAYVDLIARWIPDAYFLHVVRNGEDVIASAIDGQMRYRGQRAFVGGIGYWVQRWNRAVDVHRACARHPQHIVLPYETLLAAPERVRVLLAELSGQRPTHEAEAAADAGHIADLAAEPWKSDAADGVLRAPQRKVEDMFGPRLRQQMREQLHDYRAFIDELAELQTDDRWIARTAQRMLDQPADGAAVAAETASTSRVTRQG